jgi:hypothetical protein
MIWSRGARVNQLENRIAHLEQGVGVGQVDRDFAASLSDEDRDFYLRMKAREAAHPKGFDPPRM